MESFKGRTVVDGVLTRVYRNLHRGGYSLQQRIAKRWVVVGHADGLTLRDVTFDVRPAGRRKVLAERKKNVHAFVVGVLIRPAGEAPYGGEQVTYNPYAAGEFRTVADNRPVRSARLVKFYPAGLQAYDAKP
jgi:hypothetical protein